MQVGPALECGQEFRVLPGRDDLDLRVEGEIAQLEADLVVALARGAVGDVLRLFRVGDLDLALGDERPRQRGAEQIAALVDGVGLDGGEDVVGDELRLEVLDVDLRGAGLRAFFRTLARSSPCPTSAT